MGRGMKLIGWIKKHFMRMKKPRNKKRRVKRSTSRESFPSVDHDLNNTSVNISADTMCEVKKDKFNADVMTPNFLEGKLIVYNLFFRIMILLVTS